MVRKIFDFLYQETGSLNQAALLLGLFAFLSQVLAFLRDRLLAHIFGISQELDIYYAAFKVPDFIFVTVASIVSLSVLIPFIVEEESRGRDSLKSFINNIFSFFSILILIVSAAAYFLMPAISGLLFKGFTPEALEQVVFISRILLLSPIILGLSNLFGSLTQAYSRFAVYALSPLLYNAGIILGIIILAGSMGITGVAIGVILGAIFHAVIQVPFVVKSGLFPRPVLHLNMSSIKKVVSISLPRTLTLSMTHLSTIFLISLASLMATGSISILSLSFNLQSVPLSIIGVSYSLAAFPTLSRKFREKNLNAFIEQMATTARFILFWSAPVTALFIVLRAHIVRIILGSGLFNWEDTRLTAAALALLVFSSLFQCLSLLFIRGFYSAGFTRKPFYINLISTLLLVVGTWGLVEYFYASSEFRYFIEVLLKVEDLPGTVVLMLPLGFSIASIVNGILHLIAFEREFKGFSRHIFKTFFDSLIASVVVGAGTYAGLNVLIKFINTTTLVGILVQGVVAGIFGIACGVVALNLLKSRELAVVWRVARNKFWKTEVIATDKELV